LFRYGPTVETQQRPERVARLGEGDSRLHSWFIDCCAPAEHPASSAIWGVKKRFFAIARSQRSPFASRRSLLYCKAFRGLGRELVIRSLASTGQASWGSAFAWGKAMPYSLERKDETRRKIVRSPARRSVFGAKRTSPMRSSTSANDSKRRMRGGTPRNIPFGGTFSTRIRGSPSRS